MRSVAISASDEGGVSLVAGDDTSVACCGLANEGGIAFEDFDFDAKVVRVRRQIKKLGKPYVFALPKNDTERTIPLSDWAIQVVRRHVKDYPPQPCCLPWERSNGRPRTYHMLSLFHPELGVCPDTGWSRSACRLGA